MGFHLPAIRWASFTASQATSKSVKIPKGYVAMYVGEKQTRFLIPISYLNQPSFQDLLSEAVEEFGYDHLMGGLTIPCCEDPMLHPKTIRSKPAGTNPSEWAETPKESSQHLVKPEIETH
ncbi:hypothetical protein CR513_09658, partial [Mucuna pruriens]